MTAFATVSLIGCSENLNCWPSGGDTTDGVVSVTPVFPSETVALCAVLSDEDGVVGLDLLHAAAPARRASALQIETNFSFMCSYRG